MIAVDTNILVAWLREEYPHHDRAKEILRALAEGDPPWAIPWPCVHEFVAVVTNPRIFRNPSTLSEALDAVEALAESPSLRWLSEPADYWPTFREMASAARIAGALAHDARIAALCRVHGVSELWTADRDFSRFAGLRVRNPLAETRGKR